MGLEGQLKAAVQQGATFEARLKALEALLEAPATSVAAKAEATAPSAADLLAAKRAEAEIAQKTTGHRPFEDVLPGLFKPK
jgi:regulator of protease activity HflC (stomatin/prohibitin superfamily)